MKRNLSIHYLKNAIKDYKWTLLFSGLAGATYLLKTKTKIIDNILQFDIKDILSSKEVSEGGQIFISNILQDKHLIDTVTLSISEIISQPKLEKTLLNFGKIFSSKILENKEFTDKTKQNLAEILNQNFSDELGNFVDFIEKSDINDKVADLFKNVFTSDDVLDKLADLFQKAAMMAGDTEPIKENGLKFAEDIFSDEEFISNLKSKAFNVISIYTDEVKYIGFDTKIINENKLIIDKINMI